MAQINKQTQGFVWEGGDNGRVGRSTVWKSLRTSWIHYKSTFYYLKASQFDILAESLAHLDTECSDVLDINSATAFIQLTYTEIKEQSRGTVASKPSVIFSSISSPLKASLPQSFSLTLFVFVLQVTGKLFYVHNLANLTAITTCRQGTEDRKGLSAVGK